ncbi:MAG: signal transduction histidine kinase/ActR/RegA family two-component response regulator [Planctomycetota bacterium]|jgi:signal transduction histidine kinase/ActR/RegA family two-component response regulator
MSPRRGGIGPVIAAAISLVMLCAVFLHQTLQRSSQEIIEEMALRDAETLTNALSSFREVYTKSVIQKAKKAGMVVSRDHHGRAGVLPLPATLTMELGELIAEHDHGHGLTTTLYSDLPFPGRERTLDAFQVEALVSLRESPDQAFYRLFRTGSHSELRYASADVLTQGCVNCHNTHPETPKNDWVLGDVRGVLEIRIPLSTTRASIGAEVSRTTARVFGVLVLIAVFLVGFILKLRNTREHALVAEKAAQDATEGIRERNEFMAKTLRGLDERNAELEEQRERADRARVVIERQKQEADEARLAAIDIMEDMELARSQAEHASRSKSEFLATMSHEIRTPMNGILGMISFLMDSELSTEQREHAETVHYSAEALLTIINDILDYSKLEAGRLELELIEFDLHSCCEEVIDIFSTRAQQSGIGLSTLISRDTPRLVNGDVGRIRQVLLNLVGNAVKFTEKGDVNLEVRLKTTDSVQIIELAVHDSGIGIPKDRRERLFQPFTQLDASHNRRYGGTGLGLVISRRLIEAMNGTIEVHSTEGRGTSFIVGLPLPIFKEHGNSVALQGRRAVVAGMPSRTRASFIAQLTRLGMDVSVWKPGKSVVPEPLDFAFVPDDQAGSSTIRSELCDQAKAVFNMTSEASDDSETSITLPIRSPRLEAVLCGSLGIKSKLERESGSKLPDYGSGRSLKVLVAEDNPVNILITTRLLERVGHKVCVVENGALAVDAVLNQHYDLVLMDCQMPTMDGFEATKRIRAHECQTGTKRTPIVAMTANAMSGDRERCLKDGMDGYVSKPVNVELLYSEMQRVTDTDAPDIAA